MFVLKDDASIWDSFLAGDDQAYEYIYKQYVQKLFLYGLSLTKDEALIEDCIQDVFIRIYANRQSLGKTNNIRLYLNAALRNALLNSFKKQKTYRAFLDSLEKEESVDDDTAIDRMISHEDELEKEKLLKSLFSMLTARQKEIVYYRFIEGMGLEEISKLLSLDYHSVANTVQRALKKMRKFFNKSD